jgi:hypothetical protein
MALRLKVRSKDLTGEFGVLLTKVLSLPAFRFDPILREICADFPQPTGTGFVGTLRQRSEKIGNFTQLLL